MARTLLLIYQAIVVGIGVAATVVCIQRARRSGRDDHAAFVAFWAVFTASLIVDLVRGYIVVTVVNPSPGTLLLLSAISVDVNLLLVVTVLRYLHRLGAVRGRQLREAAALGGLFVSMIALGVPWGAEFDPARATVTLRAGFWIGEVYYVAGLLYAAILSWLFVARHARNEAPAFLVVMALFATSGLLESAVSLGRSIAHPTIRLDSVPVVYSSFVYAVYSVFLIVDGGIEESVLPARSLRFAADARENAATEPSTDPNARISAATIRFGLSERERDVVALVLDGRSNQEIADRLCVSLATVKTHLYRIYRKAAVPSRYGLIHAVGRSA